LCTSRQENEEERKREKKRKEKERKREKEKREREKGDCGKVAGGVGCHCNGVCHGPHVPTTPAAEPFLVLLYC